jgi:hypothetical protein
MDHKALKQDMTYALKKLQKDGRVLTAHGDNLEIKDKVFVESNQSDPLEAFVMMKGYAPTYEQISSIGYNVSLLDLLVENTAIAKSDWYAFLDGFDNVISYEKNEFYNVGVYLREKFSPIGARAVPLEPVVFEGHTLTGEISIKFAINVNRGKTSIMEVKCEKVLSIDNSYSYSLKPGEYKVRILAPASMFDKKPNGVMVPSIQCNYFLFESFEAAQDKAEKDIRSGFERELRKKGIAFTEEDVAAKVALIQVIRL